MPAILLCRNGRRFYLAPNNEAQRLADEDFAHLGYEPVIAPWYDDLLSPERLRSLVAA